jgi:DNA-binding NtrC family response regulator
MTVCSIKHELKFQQFTKMYPKILLIDDEDGFRKVLAEMFALLGCNVYSARNGKEGINIYKQQRTFDLVLLDMQMPFMDGRLTFRKIIRINPEQKVLIMSGYANLEDLDVVMKKGIKGFIKKPFSIYKILGKVKDIIFE